MKSGGGDNGRTSFGRRRDPNDVREGWTEEKV